MPIGSKSSQKAELRKIAKSVPVQTAPESVTPDSVRITSVLSRMYTTIISVDLSVNSFRVEAGSLRIGSELITPRGYYNTLYDAIAQNIHSSYIERFAELFSHTNLLRAMMTGKFSLSMTMLTSLFSAGTSNETNYEYAEIKAERVSGNSQHVVCLLYIRRLDSDPEIAEADNNSTVISKTPDLTMIRADKLLGGENAVFFEYDDADDEMTVHFPRSEKRTDSVIKNYLTGIDSRGGWTIHRDDIDIIRNSLLRALNGEEVAAKIRYRSIAAETVDFRTHRLTCLPVTGASSALYVVGALTDIDSEARIDQENALLNVRMRELPAVIFTDIFEIDTENDTIDRIVRTDTGYAPKKDAKKLSKYVSFIISSGIVSPDAEIYYSSLIKEGFLEEKTRNGPFEFESQHRSRGETKYRSMHEVIMRLDRKHRFLLLRHELAALDRSREVKAEADQAEKKNELQKLVSLLQTKNTGSKDHNMHVSHITTILLEDLMTRRPQYGITPESIRAYAEAGFLHDIGKVTLPDDILETRGERSDEDRIKYEKHTINGAVLLDRVDSSKNGERLAACRDAALHHHERYDGAGYPERLRGAEISIGAQAVGLADAYDTILGKKCMKESMPHEKAVRYILDGECGAFNPHLLESIRATAFKIKAVYSED